MRLCVKMLPGNNFLILIDSKPNHRKRKVKIINIIITAVRIHIRF